MSDPFDLEAFEKLLEDTDWASPMTNEVSAELFRLIAVHRKVMAELSEPLDLSKLLGPELFRNREHFCSSHSGKGSGLLCSACVDDL